MLRRPLEFQDSSQTCPLASLPLALTGLVALLLLTACGSRPPAQVSESSQTDANNDGIAWYEGDVAEAFVLAQSQGKPLFLYWGAEWCPPCHYLREKLFSRPDFIARMQSFVPVYLDGDTERAQIWGEELAVKGYPTVIVFSPAGEEVMRMPSTLPVDQYQQVLDAAMSSTRPVNEVLEVVMASGPSTADPSDLSTLAFYSWDQDSSVDLEATERMEIFRRLHAESPAELEVERSRFFTHSLVAAIEVHRQDSESGQAATVSAGPVSEGTVPDEQIEATRREALKILEDDHLRSANLAWVLYYSSDTVDLLAPDPGDERSELIDAWRAAAVDVENDTTLSINDRLSALMPQIALAKASDHSQGSSTEEEPWEASEELRQHVRERVSWATEEVTDEGELQTTMNTMAYLLSSVGLESETEALLASRMNDAAAPYYFMSWMGSLKEEAGETQEALVWYRKAYESSTGRYSRFRWGSMYLRHLLELAPEDSQTIEDHSLEVLTELLALEDAFAGGNYSRLEGLERAYLDWNESGDRLATIDRVRDFVHDSCERFPAGGTESQQSRCSSFLIDDSESSTDPA